MPSCFVPGCRSGYYHSSTDSGKRHFFKVKDNILDSWRKAIPRKDKLLTRNCHICDLHFDNRFILKTYKTVINGETVETERGKWDLTKDAVPTIFPNLPSYCSK